MLQTSVHLPIFWTLWALPKTTIPISKYIPWSVGIITNSFHSFRKTVVILRSNAQWAKERESVSLKRLLTSSYWDQRPISNELTCASLHTHTQMKVRCFEMTTCNSCVVVGEDNYNTGHDSPLPELVIVIRPSKKLPRHILEPAWLVVYFWRVFHSH